MTCTAEESLAAANALCQSILLNSYVESYGVSHQVPFIEFRQDGKPDAWLSIDTRLSLGPYENPQGMTTDELVLLYMHQINLQRVTAVGCSAQADLQLQFENGLMLTLHGDAADTVEPWQLSSGLPTNEGGRLIIALSGGGYAIW
ncbi:hypothetical protein [Hymenobacter sp. B81]|uniref:hypothetical protein n=1 Tax=Hymenobacter sp. B81 TaxID=3344878 RepID=UPI0037DBFE88